MAYHLIAYFNWVVAGLGYRMLPRKRRTRVGWTLIGAGTAVQVVAFVLHWSQWNRLQGQPDAMYAWIVPALLAVIAFVAVVAAFACAVFRRDSPVA